MEHSTQVDGALHACGVSYCVTITQGDVRLVVLGVASPVQTRKLRGCAAVLAVDERQGDRRVGGEGLVGGCRRIGRPALRGVAAELDRARVGSCYPDVPARIARRRTGR